MNTSAGCEDRAIKAIGIAGSPRPRGNSTVLMNAVLQGAASAGAETASIRLNELTFRGCQGCEPCAPKGDCVQRDSLGPVYAALRLADIWVLASPIYYDGVSGQMKVFFDRCRCLTNDGGKRERRIAGRRSAAVVVTYEDKPRDDYKKAAQVLADYLGWMGDFGTVEVMAEGALGPVGAVAAAEGLLEKAEAIGKELAQDQRGT